MTQFRLLFDRNYEKSLRNLLRGIYVQKKMSHLTRSRRVAALCICTHVREGRMMRLNWQRRLIQIWLASTLVILAAWGVLLRPDRDLAEYANYQRVSDYPSELQARQLETHFNLLRTRGLALDGIMEDLLSNRSLTREALKEIRMHRLIFNKKRQAQERIGSFVAFALMLPLSVLELGMACFWLNRGCVAMINSQRLKSVLTHGPSAGPK